jgi:uncharacterized protein (DUF427 family)
MSEKRALAPGPNHPIDIVANASRLIVTLDGEVLADTRRALTLHEANYPAVQYIPRGDVDMTRLSRSNHSTYCPYKGDCSYYDLLGRGERGAHGVWTYESPYPAVAPIKDHLAFYPDRVAIAEVA